MPQNTQAMSQVQPRPFYEFKLTNNDDEYVKKQVCEISNLLQSTDSSAND